jgi:hypothetical protein
MKMYTESEDLQIFKNFLFKIAKLRGSFTPVSRHQVTRPPGDGATSCG